ncbi:flagellar protein FlgN [Paenibacillus soyae]|uniref:Flagellar protein FlgN n=1 Tax=Paenibacillus soyae TaxID=2969249 RepID=A0A9X2SCF9_9BACL|nr:flagellar protein FlgN [Paenibacillus soyae]MCR2806738.1 flagellar protein FlgN [Paenibacillus soyae]
MNETIQQIAATLEELIHEHKQLIEYGKAKTEALRQNSIDSLSYIANKEKKILDQILKLEQSRIFLVGKYMTSQKISGHQRSFKLEKLIQMVYHAGEKQLLQRLWDELNAVVTELQEINEFNQQLVKMTLEYLHFSQDLLLGPEEDDVTYHRHIQDAARRRASQFNIKT